jgi:cell division protein FtsB
MNRLVSHSSKKSIFYGFSLSFWVFFVLMAIFKSDGVLAVFEFERNLKILELRNERLLGENQQIKSEIHALKTNPSEIEKVAREKLNLVKPKDKVFQFIRAPENKSQFFNKS